MPPILLTIKFYLPKPRPVLTNRSHLLDRFTTLVQAEEHGMRNKGDRSRVEACLSAALYESISCSL